MLKRRGNFPYDFDSAYPDHPTPAMPPNPVQNPARPPAAPVAPAPLEPPLAVTPPAPAPPDIKLESPKSQPPKPRRRSVPLTHRSSPSANSGPVPPDESKASRHSRKCSVCNHPERDVIDDDYIHWARVVSIAEQFGLTECSVRRHASATGLHRVRREKIHSALDLIVEQSSIANVTAHSVIRAIRAYSCITPSGRWVELPRRVTYTGENAAQPASTSPLPIPAPTNTDANPILKSTPPISSNGVLIDCPGIRK
jgi:hypothetical protein